MTETEAAKAWAKTQAEEALLRMQDNKGLLLPCGCLAPLNPRHVQMMGDLLGPEEALAKYQQGVAQGHLCPSAASDPLLPGPAAPTP